MIPSPNLDDRTFEELVEEAKRLIPQYCPEWTNFNASDPGITLLELYAWMTELMLYRLNKVPEKNYLAFLELMGVRLESPQAASTILEFVPSETAGVVEIPSGSGFLTRAEGGNRPVPFETVEELTVVNTRLKKVLTQVRSVKEGKTLIEDVSGAALEESVTAFRPFQGTKVVERYLYLGDARLENLTEDAILSVRVERSTETARSLGQLLTWEYFDGQGWRELSESPVEVDERTQVFEGPPRLEPNVVDGVESTWIRARLVEVPEDSAETLLDTIRGKLEVVGEGIVPEKMLANVAGDIFLNRDPDKNFLPFDREPAIDSTFYLRCDSILSQEDCVIRLELELSDPSLAEAPQPSGDLTLRWEFYNGKKWVLIGKTGKDGVPDRQPGRYGLVDGTHAFSVSGVVEFARPQTMQVVEVNGEEAHWLRVRLEQGDYGVPGSYENVDDRWVWQDVRPLRPPSIKRIAFKSTEEASPFEYVWTYNDWCFGDFSVQAGQESQAFQAFEPVPEESPTVYLGFSEKFPECETHFYVKLREDLNGGASGEGSEQAIVWEFWDGKNWSSLLPRDETQGLTRSGFVRFNSPKNLRKSKRFGESLFWMRARLEMGGYDLAPEIERILLNTVMVRNFVTYRDSILGSSQGTPNQSFSFSRGPVLAGQAIVVREKDEPTSAEREVIEAEEGADAIVSDPNQSGYWLVRWHEVPSLYESSGRSRHYMKDVVTGEISFGDGVHGMIPPKMARGVLAAAYPVGGGEEGNVTANSISVMKQSFSFIDSVSNPFPATGGCDMESVEALKQRGPHVLKSRDRAVTAEDFEWLAIQASNSVARVKAMSSRERVGEVDVIVVPKVSGGLGPSADLSEKPAPSTELLRRVERYLDERRLLTTVVRVLRPSYQDISVELKIVRANSGPSDRIKRQIDRNLRRFLHPLCGGRDGKGWPFGRSVYKVDLYHVVEEVEGVDFVEGVRMRDLARDEETEQLRLEDNQLVHLVDVTVTEISREQIK